jgi:hypothetical protein
MRWWKVLGLAGIAGVAATGVVVARAERHRRAYTADEIRSRLHARLADVDGSGAGSGAGGSRSDGSDAAGPGIRARRGW